MKRLMLLIPLLSAVAAAQGHCTLMNAAVGTYAVSYIGWVTVGQGASSVTIPGTIVGVISIRWDGTLSGGGAVSGMGPVTDYDISGTVELKPDCTGTLRMKPKRKAGGPAETEIDRFVFVPDQKMLVTTIVDMGAGFYPAITGTWRRISPWPDAASW
jgi:hypothetical protein